jgi:tRNA pseudouridine55 synthase
MNSCFLLLNKPPGVTSFDALYPVKKALSTGKVGHTGTLDKFAEGLLVVLCKRALKLSPFILHADKRYEARVFFGSETDTLDPEGRVIACAPLPTRAAVEAALEQFRGKTMQKPPVYSALHIGGKRASALARGGAAPEMTPREITIYELSLVEWTPPEALLAVHCAAGVYIRALARDIALAASSRAHLSALRRTQVGPFSLCAAVSPAASFDEICGALRPLDRSFFKLWEIAVVEAEDALHAALLQGKPLDALFPENALGAMEGAQRAAVFCGGRFTALLVRSAARRWKYGFVCPE